MDDIVTHLAMIERDIAVAKREARDAMLKKHGITKRGLEELRDKVLATVGPDKFFETEFGNIQTIPEGPITYKISREGHQEKKQQVVFILTER